MKPQRPIFFIFILSCLLISPAFSTPRVEILYGPESGSSLASGESVFFTFNSSCVGEDCGAPSPGSGAVIILAAGDADEESNKAWSATENIVKKIYNGFSTLGFSDEDICLIMDKPSLDINGDGIPDQIVDHSEMMRSSVKAKISSFAVEHYTSGETLYLWFAGHAGKYDPENTVRFTLSLLDNEYLSALDLQNTLTAFQTSTGCNSVVIFIESCFAGLFRPRLANPDRRIIVTAAEDDYIRLSSSSDKLFSSELMNHILDSDSLGSAFIKARMTIRNEAIGEQLPEIDANGDGKVLPTEERDVEQALAAWIFRYLNPRSGLM